MSRAIGLIMKNRSSKHDMIRRILPVGVRARLTEYEEGEAVETYDCRILKTHNMLVYVRLCENNEITIIDASAFAIEVVQ